MSLSCHNCPDVVQAVSLMAIVNPRIQAVVIDGALYQAEVEQAPGDGGARWSTSTARCSALAA
jgi:hypothetical protein